MTSLMHSIQGRQRVRRGVWVMTQLAVVLVLGGCSIWPKALTFSSSEPEPVAQAPAATPAQTAASAPAPVACADCADNAIKRDPVTVMRTVAIPPPAEPTPAVPAPVVMAKPVVAGAAPPAMEPDAPRVYAPAAQAQSPMQAQPHHAEKPVRKAPASGLVRGYYVNAGLFAVASNGNKAYRKMEQAGLPVFSDTVGSAKGQLTRVRVGPYATRAKADAAAKKIRALKLDAKVFKH